MPDTLADRARVEAARIHSGTNLVQHVTPHVPGFDTTTMPVELELPARPRDPKSVVMLTVHVTDVAGGFGVAKSLVAKWRRMLGLGKVPAELRTQLPDATDLGGSSFLLGLLERYSQLAYHRIGSRRAGNVRNHPLSLRTSHGNSGNDGAGWALDCGHAEDLTPDLVRVGCASLEAEIREIVASGGGNAIVIPHRAWSDQRRVDTDKRVWMEVVKPTVQSLAGQAVPVVIGYDVKAKSGLPIPRSWDPDALYDDKGRRVA